MLRCPHCKSKRLVGTAILKIDFEPDEDGFDFDYGRAEDQISDLIRTNGAVTFYCANCYKEFRGKEALIEDED